MSLILCPPFSPQPHLRNRRSECFPAHRSCQGSKCIKLKNLKTPRCLTSLQTRDLRHQQGLRQSPSARLTSHTQRQLRTACPVHSSQPHGAPNADVSFGGPSAHPQSPLVSSHTHLIFTAYPRPLPSHPLPHHPHDQPALRRLRESGVPSSCAPRGRPRGGWSGAGHVVTVSPCAHAQMVQRARDGTTGRGEARPRPPGPAPAPRSAAPPPRGVPGRSSPQWRPRAARGRREYSRGRPVKRLPRGGAGRLGRVKGAGPAPPAGVDEVRGLKRVALRGAPRP